VPGPWRAAYSSPGSAGPAAAPDWMRRSGRRTLERGRVWLRCQCYQCLWLPRQGWRQRRQASQVTQQPPLGLLQCQRRLHAARATTACRWRRHHRYWHWRWHWHHQCCRRRHWQRVRGCWRRQQHSRQLRRRQRHAGMPPLQPQPPSPPPTPARALAPAQVTLRWPAAVAAGVDDVQLHTPMTGQRRKGEGEREKGERARCRRQ
jgi:hypothetical protein